MEEMSREVLEGHFKNIEDSINGMEETLKEILKKLGKQNDDLIRVEKDVESIQKDIDEIKADHKEDLESTKTEQEKHIDTIWQEIRRRDKKQMWIIGISITLVSVVASVVNMMTK